MPAAARNTAKRDGDADMSLRPLFADTRARRYLAGQSLSLLGDSSMWLACGIWVKSLTGSDSAAGLTFFFFTAPAVLAPMAGLLVDRTSPAVAHRREPGRRAHPSRPCCSSTTPRTCG
jgi:hypothetical protein